MWALWVIAILLGLLGLFLIALCVPIDAALDWDTSARPKSRLRLVWLFGLVSKEFGRGKSKPEEKRKPLRKKPNGRADFANMLRILRTKGLLRKFVNLVRDVFRQLRIKELLIDLKVGLDDPADTGMLFAIIGSVTPLLQLLPGKYQIAVQPSFPETTFEGRFHGVLRLQPIRLVIPVLRFMFSLPTFRAVKTLVTSKWKRKR